MNNHGNLIISLGQLVVILVPRLRNWVSMCFRVSLLAEALFDEAGRR